MPRLHRLFAAPTLLLLAAAGCLPERDFMPLAIGNRWDYRISFDDGRVAPVRLELDGRESRLTWSGRDGRTGCLWSKEDGIVSVQQEGARVYLLWLPPAIGAGWWTVTPDGQRVWCRVAGRETVNVPAGAFRDCVEVVMEQPGGASEMRHWFAPGVGWVRYSWGPRGGRPWMVRELVAYRLRPEDKYVEAKKTTDQPQMNAD
jgi:hypothetical protein